MVGIKHNPLTGVNNPNYQVSKDVYNSNHVIDDLSVGISKINATGTPSASNYLRGDGSWNTPSGGGGGLIRTKAKYTIVLESGYYHVYKDDGTLNYSTSSFATAMNSQVFNGLTANRLAPEHVVTKGEIEIDDTILYPSDVDIEIFGSWTSLHSLNKDAIKNQGTNAEGVSFRGHRAFIQGNGYYQNSGKLFSQVNSTTNSRDYLVASLYPRALYLEGINFIYGQAPDSAMYINYNGSAGSTLKWRNVTVSGGHLTDSVYSTILQSVYDSDICDSFINGGPKALNVQSCAGMSMDFSYFNGCALLYGTSQSTIHVKYWDNSSDVHSLELLYARWNNIHNSYFHRVGGSGYTTKSAIYMNNTGSPYYSTDNIVSNSIFTRSGFGGSNTFKYAIEEASNGDDNNIYSGINGRDCNTGALRVLGPNSDYGHIIGDVILV